MTGNIFLALVLAASGDFSAQMERVFSTPTFAAKRFGPARWIENGAAYSTVENGAILRYDTATGRKSTLVSAAQLTPPGAKPLEIEDYEWSADSRWLLVFTNTRKVWRLNTRGDYWVLDLGAGKLTKLGGNGPEASLMFAKFSPDATRVGYVRANNIYVEDLASGQVRALTTDGSATTINGTSDWVYEEELYVRDGFRWSPDGKSIAYWNFDTTGVENFALINNTDSLYPKITNIPYPKAGTTNSAVRIGVVPAAGGETRWMAIPGDPRNHYLAKLEWRGNQLEVSQLNRLQNTNIIFHADAATGKVREVLRDSDEAWVDIQDFDDGLPVVNGGKDLLFLSERDGWRHAWAAPLAGGAPVVLTPGNYDVISFVGLDREARWMYFIASPDNTTQRFLYRAPVDRSSPPTRLTPNTLPGVHSYRLSPDARWAFHTWSRFDQPPVTELVSLPDHKPVRTLEANAALRGVAASSVKPGVEFFAVDLSPELRFDGWMLKPRNFDPARKYPVVVHVYGEPASVTVVDQWQGVRGLFHHALADEGYIVLSIDNRGTPAPKGRAWRKAIYGAVGLLSAQDQSEALLALAKSRPYLDLSRVGVWGWSGGGSNTLNMMFRSPDLYKVGVAVASVPDQKLYDTIYQERYMGVPQDNANGYRLGSPIHHATGLRGKLLLIHGTGDDNVHHQGAEVLVNRLIELGKPFDFMAYPNRSHSINEGRGTSLHLYNKIASYFFDHLPAGPR